MAWQSGGGSGYPGVTSDNALGLIIAHALQAGDQTAVTVPDFMNFWGATAFTDTHANGADSDQVVVINQQAALLPDDIAPHAFRVRRSGSIADADYVQPAAEILDTTTSAQPVFRVTKHGAIVLELSALQPITGALSTVTDAAAKAVLTSVIAALTGIKVATNNTT